MKVRIAHRLYVALVCCVFPSAVIAKQVTADPAVSYANKVARDHVAYHEGYFGSGDTRLHYVEAGRGPLVILYHGFPSFWFSFFDQMEVLKTRYRVVAVDGLGAGLSAKPVELAPYRIDRLAAQLDNLARHLNGRKRFALIGHDWGSALAFAYAQGYPGRLTAVIGLSAPPYNLFLDLVASDTDQQRRSAYMESFLNLTLADLKVPGVTERIWQQSYGRLIAAGGLTAQEGELFRQALADPLAVNGGMNWYRANITAFTKVRDQQRWPVGNPKIPVPALLIWGDADQTFVGAAADRMPDYASDVTVIHLPGINHWATMEQPELANQAIGEFLAKHHPARRVRK